MIPPRAWIASGPPGRLGDVRLRVSALELESLPGRLKVSVQTMTADGPIAEAPITWGWMSEAELSEYLGNSIADGWGVEAHVPAPPGPRIPFKLTPEGIAEKRRYQREYMRLKRARLKEAA